MRKVYLLLVTVALLLSMAGQAAASAITYKEQVTASGTLGSNPFTDALLTISWTGDTTGVTGGSGFFTNQAGPNTVSLNIAGLGNFIFTDDMDVFVNQNFFPPAVGFGSNTTRGSVLDTLDNAFGTYDLTTAIGPITDTSFIRPDLPNGTTGGLLTIVSAGDSTFTATLGATTPEPSSILLFGSGILGLAGVLRRKLL
jgi:hypothetical protein